ncbi:MAG: hypothetical protein Q4F92_08885 [Acidaminococcus sp.]|uniref:hypothetical protein n=1 Tax=Acidaminococcus sp. TaxID=1872103 RepID=UPI0026E09C45|nr:hypothetical protein [Acidaminococcus sp.]MDO5598432.1 hypothetical protein [Acidaminococcus sp.]
MSLEIKTHLQNLSNEMGCVETELSYMAAKLRPDSSDEATHDVLLQAIDRVSHTRDKLKDEEDFLKRKLVQR